MKPPRLRVWRKPTHIFIVTMIGHRSIGLTLWRYGAVSFLWNGDAPLQIVFGDWWRADDEAGRRRCAYRQQRKAAA